MRARVKPGALAMVNEDDPDRRNQLTEGASYVVLGVSNECFRVIENNGEPILYPKELFDVVDRRIPAGWELREDTEAQLAAHATLLHVLESMLAWADETDHALIARDLERVVNRQRAARTRPGQRLDD